MTDAKWIVTRRCFLKSTAAAAGLMLGARAFADDKREDSKPVRFGIVTDTHYADIDTRGSRYYRESTKKLAECVELMNDKQVDFVVELGDFINGAPDDNLQNLQAFEAVFGKFSGPRYHVLGNHDMERLSKSQFLTNVENTDIPKTSAHYSFDRRGWHFVVLDANYRADGTDYKAGNFKWTDANLPQDQLTWLEKDLAETDLPTVLFIHQLLERDEGSHYVRNAAEVRRVLAKHSGISAVFQGHQHRGQYHRIGGVHYYTLKAMVEGAGKPNSSYAIVELHDDASMTITGYRRATGRRLMAASS